MKKIFVLMLCALMIFSSVGAYASFPDIESDTAMWAGEAIDALSESGVISGYPDGTFKPLNNVSRGEFAKMLSVAFDLEETKAYFEDISDNWAIQYILRAVSCMYTEGAFFKPDEDATRADIAYAVAKALNLEPASDYADKFADSDEISAGMKEAVYSAIEAGLILGYDDGTLRPNDPVTRAEAATIIYRAVNIKNTPEADAPDVEIPSVPEKPVEEKEHIYTLYPCRDLLLITSVSQTSQTVDGDEAIVISYRIANTEDEYTSVIPADTKVMGLKTTALSLDSGDVLVMDTAFHGTIGCLYVFATFDSSAPTFDTALTTFRDYSTAFGKITSFDKSSKAAIITLEGGTTETVPLKLDTNVYSPWKRADKWSLDGVGGIDITEEDTYVFIRYTDDVATEVIVSDLIR